MRIAVITDIHGNLPALEAALADIRARGIARLLNLGDCVSGMMWPRETAALLMQAEVPTLRGNHDRWLAEQEPAAMGRQDAFAHGEIDADQRAWLGALPAMLQPAPGVLACHGTPSSDTTNLLEDAAHGHLGPARPAAVRARLGEAGNAATVVLCGHSHLPSIVRLPGGEGPLVVNPGSLGCPAFRVTRGPAPHRSESRSPHARYAILHLPEGGAPAAELVAIAYDWDAAARRAEALGSPAWAYALRTGYIPDED